MNLISLLKRCFMPIYLKNSTKIILHITYFVKTWYFVIANLVCTNKKSNTFCGNFTDFKKCSGYILHKDFHLHPISCQKSSLAYVTLLHLRLQKHFPLMTGKCSQQKWTPILVIFVSVMNSVPQWVIQLSLENES